jgi:hypothetical protein
VAPACRWSGDAGDDVALLYHAINHAFMKSLLFLGTGAVLHATGERNLGRLGGLIHRMPWVAWLTLVGVLAIAGLPPLNGFVSEWLLLQAFLFAHQVPHTFVNMLLPMGAALLVLAAALAGYVMVKFFGVIFLGQPREAALQQAHDAGWLERLGLAWLALACVLLGLLPVQVLPALTRVAVGLGFSELPAATSPWLLLPLPERGASYAPLLFLAAISRRGGRGLRWRAHPLPRARAARAAVGLRLRAPGRAHAGHGGGFRAADPPHLRCLLRAAARAALAVRSRAALPRGDR